MLKKKKKDFLKKISIKIRKLILKTIINLKIYINLEKYQIIFLLI